MQHRVRQKKWCYRREGVIVIRRFTSRDCHFAHISYYKHEVTRRNIMSSDTAREALKRLPRVVGLSTVIQPDRQKRTNLFHSAGDTPRSALLH